MSPALVHAKAVAARHDQLVELEGEFPSSWKFAQVVALSPSRESSP
jgi:hypothetical protein